MNLNSGTPTPTPTHLCHWKWCCIACISCIPVSCNRRAHSVCFIQKNFSTFQSSSFVHSVVRFQFKRRGHKINNNSEHEKEKREKTKWKTAYKNCQTINKKTEWFQSNEHGIFGRWLIYYVFSAWDKLNVVNVLDKFTANLLSWLVFFLFSYSLPIFNARWMFLFSK